MLVFASNSILPAWVVVPIAAVMMLVIAGHILAIQEVEMPVRRRRIRSVNGFLMMVVTAMLAYALSLADVGKTTADAEAAREFVLVWVLIMALVGIVVMLAGLDVLTTVRSHNRARRELREEFAQQLARELPGRTVVGYVGGGKEEEEGEFSEDKKI